MKIGRCSEVLAAFAAVVAIALAAEVRATTVPDPCDIDSTHRPSTHCPDECPTEDDCITEIEDN